MNLYAIKDQALGAFTNLMVFPSDGVAIRSFTNEVNRRDSEIAAHPQDYDLYRIGYMDDRTGQLEGNESLLVRAVQVRITEDKNHV